MYLSRDICDLNGNGEGGRAEGISPSPLTHQMTYSTAKWQMNKTQTGVSSLTSMEIRDGEFYARAEFLKISHNYMLLNLQLISSKVKKENSYNFNFLHKSYSNNYCTIPTLNNSYLFALITAVMYIRRLNN